MSPNKCQICAHRGHDRGGLFCTSCARAAVYNLRLNHAQVLLDRERLAAQIAELTDSARQTTQKPRRLIEDAPHEERSRASARHAESQLDLQKSRDRTELASRQAAKLRAVLKKEREQLDGKRKELAMRRRSLDTSRARLAALDRAATSATVALQSAHSFEHLQQNITAWRAQHLRTLYFWTRLQRRPGPGSRHNGAGDTFEYHIGGLLIPDLRSLNSMREGQEGQLSAALSHLSRLLYLAARYLQVRLPAEIIPPHCDWPLPMIFTPLSSYTGNATQFPYKLLASPANSRIGRSTKAEDDFTYGPRPRPLFISRPPKLMAGDDSQAYNRFVEALAMIAWDVAWLCRVQGLPVAGERWEDACNIGQNLWMLLRECAAQAQSSLQGLPPISRHSSSRTALQSARLTARTDRLAYSSNNNANRSSPSGIGLYSHGTAQNFLRAGSNTGAQHRTMDVSLRGWQMGNPVKIISELRAALLGELAIMEAVLVGDDGEELGTAENGMQLLASEHRDEGSEADDSSERTRDAVASRLKGTSGWMKLRNRR